MPITFPRRLPFVPARLMPSSRLWARLAIATNWPVLAAVAALSVVGVLTITAYDAAQGRRQFMYLGVAILCMIAFQAVNYLKIGRLAWGFYFVSFLPIIYTVMAASVGGLPFVERRNGAFNWIQLPGGMSIQPAEVMKVAFIMALARYLRYRENYRSVVGLFAPFALCLAPMILILKQPDLGTAMVFGPTLLAMLFVAGARLRHIFIIITLSMVLMVVAWNAGREGTVFASLPTVVKKYQRERVEALFRTDDPSLKDIRFQQEQALTAIGSGGLTGKGWGQIPAGQSVPEGQNDMIFSLIGEQFGLVGTVIVIVAYCMLFAAGIEIAAATREPFGRLVAIGIVAMLAFQAFLNIAVTLKIMPVTGVTLPFISAGGSSLIASYMFAGLLLNIGQNRPLVMAGDSFEFGD